MARFWTPEKMKRLRALVQAGHSSPSIAREIGNTKAAVMSKVISMGLRLVRSPAYRAPKAALASVKPRHYKILSDLPKIRPQRAVESKCVVVRVPAQPARRKAQPVTQFRLPETDLDKEIYGRPLNERLRKITPENCVSVPVPGDKPEGWAEQVRAAEMRKSIQTGGAA